MTTAPDRNRPASDGRQPGTDRLISFSDGVIAIAITLLVLPLTDIRPDGTSVLTVLMDNRAALLGFALTFVVIAHYWVSHHTLLQSLRGHSPGLIAINMTWLGIIVFLPFPTSLIQGDIRHGYATLYITTLVVASMVSLVLARYLQQHPELRDPADAPALGSFVVGSWAAIGALFVAAGVSLLSPRLGMIALLLLIPAQQVAARAVHRGLRPTHEVDSDH